MEKTLEEGADVEIINTCLRGQKLRGHQQGTRQLSTGSTDAAWSEDILFRFSRNNQCYNSPMIVLRSEQAIRFCEIDTEFEITRKSTGC